MKVCSSYYNSFNNYNAYTKLNNPNFGSKSVLVEKCAKKVGNKFLPFAFAASLLALVATSCGGFSNRYDETYTQDGVTVELMEVQPETKDSVLAPVFELKSQLTSENDFLQNIKVDVIRSFRGIDGEKDSFHGYLREYHSNRSVKGMSFYSDNKLEKRIAIQERAHEGENANISRVAEMRQSLMHEVGHQFDNYFGHDHNADFALEWDSMQYSKSLSPKQTQYDFASITSAEQSIDKKYNSQNELSDRREFKEAFLKDLEIVKELMKKSPKSLPKNINYYIGGLELSKPVSIEMLGVGSKNCSEVYANTFSYLMGTNEGDRDAFLQAFPNCKEIVQKDIAKYLHIQK